MKLTVGLKFLQCLICFPQLLFWHSWNTHITVSLRTVANCQNSSCIWVLCCYLSLCAGYKVIKKIGEGTFSEVLKTQSLKDGKFYACKTMKQTINRYSVPKPVLHHFSVVLDLCHLPLMRLCDLSPCCNEATVVLFFVQPFAVFPYTGTHHLSTAPESDMHKCDLFQPRAG